MKLDRFYIIAWALLFSSLALASEVQESEPSLESAAAYEKDGVYDLAARQYQAVVDALQEELGELDIALVEPLMGLGRSYMKLRDFGRAKEALQHAQHIMHKTDGIHTLRQLEIVDLMTWIDLEQSDPLGADREQQMSLYVSEHNYGKDSVDLLPALYKMSQWYMDTGQHQRARRTLERCKDIISEQLGDDDPRMIEALMMSATNTRLQQTCCSYKYLEKAKNIVEDNPAVADDERAEVYISLADAYIASNKDDLANEYYEKGWKLMGNEVAGTLFDEPELIPMSQELDRVKHAQTETWRLRRNELGQTELTKLLNDERLAMKSVPPQQFFVPVTGTSDRPFRIDDGFRSDPTINLTQRVIGAPFQFLYDQLLEILPLSRRSDEDLALLTVQMEFTVRSDGRVADVEIDGEHLPGKLIGLMRKVLFRTKFRPQLVDGKPVETKHVKLIQRFDP
jgi:tetratricopeptide (TPR) repeat protein